MNGTRLQCVVGTLTKHRRAAVLGCHDNSVLLQVLLPLHRKISLHILAVTVAAFNTPQSSQATGEMRVCLPQPKIKPQVLAGGSSERRHWATLRR